MKDGLIIFKPIFLQNNYLTFLLLIQVMKIVRFLKYSEPSVRISKHASKFMFKF